MYEGIPGSSIPEFHNHLVNLAVGRKLILNLLSTDISYESPIGQEIIKALGLDEGTIEWAAKTLVRSGLVTRDARGLLLNESADVPPVDDRLRRVLDTYLQQYADLESKVTELNQATAQAAADIVLGNFSPSDNL